MTAILIGLTGFLLGIVSTLAVAQRVLSKIMDAQDERDWAGQYGPPTTPEQRRTQR